MPKGVQHEYAAIRNLVGPRAPLKSDVALSSPIYFAHVHHAIRENVQIVFKSPIENFDRAVRVFRLQVLSERNNSIGPNPDAAGPVKPANRCDLPIESGTD